MIIGISGKIGAGKTKLAEILYTHFGYEPKIFAGKLKQIASILTGVSIHDQYTTEGKALYLPEWDMTVGELQQRLGTDAVRNGLHSQAWVNALFADYKPGDKWTISDMRFPNEAEAVLDRGGIVVRIDGTRTGPGKRDPNHISETALDHWQDWHFRFDNSELSYKELIEYARAIHTLAQWEVDHV